MRHDRPARIAFLLSSLKFGGGERVALNLGHALKAEGCEVHFLLMKNEGELLQEAAQSFTVVDLQCPRTWQLPLRLAGYLLRHRPYAVISSFWKLNLCACLARLACPRSKLLLWEHSPPSRSKNSPTWLYAVTASLLYQFGTRIVTVSTGVYSDVRRITAGLRRKTLVIFNPVPPPDLTVRHPAQAAGPKRIIWVGRLDEPKNPHLVLEAFALLPPGLDCTLQIVGDGTLRGELEILAATLGLGGRVSLLGYRRDACALMAQADLLVLSSDREGLPTVLVEALYCGLSVVSTDCGAGIHDILLDERYGSITPTRDKAALCAAMQRELAAPRDPLVQQEGARRFLPKAIVREFLTAMNLAAPR